MALPLSESQRQRAGMVKAAEETFEDHFHRNWGGVYGVLRRLVGDPAEAEDLAMEVFWRLYQNPPRTGNDSELRAWLFRVATNLGYNAIRSRGRRQRYEVEGGQRDLTTERATDPALETQRREEQAMVHEVIGGMKRRQAQLIALRYSGFSYTEIADVIQVAPSSVGKLLSRAEVDFERRFRKLEGNRNDSSE